jgi:hypothetical protein
VATTRATIVRSLFLISCIAGSAGAQSAASCTETAFTTQQVLTELKSLRVELLQDLADRKAERIELLAVELERTRALRIRNEQALQSNQQDTQTWSHELPSAEYTPEERARLETEKAAVDMDAVARLNRQRDTAAQREWVLSMRLNAEKERLQRLTEALRAFERPR